MPHDTPPPTGDLDHCPTCGMPYLQCGTPWPPSLHDVATVHCRLPRGHRSPEHWHRPLWPGGAALVWVDDLDDDGADTTPASSAGPA